jgi:RNA polymerase sigma-70 factor (ECF subfamily)
VAALDQILKECKQYNKFAQKLLYDRYAPIMKGICFRYVTDPDIVNDIVQEGFIKVFSKIKQYSGNGSFEGWMKRIFINGAISYLREQQKTLEHLNIEEVDETNIIEDHVNFDESSFNKDVIDDFQLIISADFSEAELLEVLNRIPIKYRTVFNLFCIENYKHEEIAQVLDIDVSTSRTRLLRARNIIQKELIEMSIEKLSA